jgi:hypothetical protein
MSRAEELRMSKVFKLSVGGLKNIIAEERKKIFKEMKAMQGFGPVGDVTKKSKETKEVAADEHGKPEIREKSVDQLKAQKIKEAKLIIALKKLREEMQVSRKKINEKVNKVGNK